MFHTISLIDNNPLNEFFSYLGLITSRETEKKSPFENRQAEIEPEIPKVISTLDATTGQKVFEMYSQGYYDEAKEEYIFPKLIEIAKKLDIPYKLLVEYKISDEKDWDELRRKNIKKIVDEEKMEMELIFSKERLQFKKKVFETSKELLEILNGSLVYAQNDPKTLLQLTKSLKDIQIIAEDSLRIIDVTNQNSNGDVKIELNLV